ncbi:MAG: DNA polymerase IV [Flavobacteriales bacterium]|nr:DNA polymerase IV [Flavobacteriales bacterium]MCB9363760.1 DNA polymerase IV [Flavobacteriales bacterium]
MPDTIRKILHIDMDAFYASVEQRDNPELVGKPIAVGGSKERGVVAAASYEARKYGVRSAMPSITAYKKCPHIIFVKPRFDAYKEASRQIHEVFAEYTDLIEPLSLDEAYLDVTENKKNLEFAMDVAQEIKEQIKAKTGLTASAGISYNKFLAKIASDYNKPDGFYVITPKMAPSFVEELKIEKFFGVGKVTAQKMHKHAIFKGSDLKNKSLYDLERWFGKSGKYYYNVSRGIDNRLVNPNRIRKSIAAERTYNKDISTEVVLIERINEVADILIKRLGKTETNGKSLTLKVKYADFKQITRSKTLPEPIPHEKIKEMSADLIKLIPEIEKGIRLLGLQISNFEQDNNDQFLGQLEFDFKSE